jgi:dUTP pyrophosphatase
MEVKVKRLKDDAKLPCYAHPGDIGMDVYSLEEVTIQPGERHLFYLGFAMEFPEGYGGFMKDKGSTSFKYGLHVMGGVYDAGYRGEYNVYLINLSDKPAQIEKHQKIAQFVLFPVSISTITETDTLADSSRGEGRHGSTGKF